MTHLFNDPTAFADEARAGFVEANARWVRGVRGGVVRSDLPVEPRVAVVIGGGTGHYPAFAGLVGEGLATGAVMGNLFASPSAQQAISVAREAQTGAGVLFSYGNYAGDVLNFDQAAVELRSAGIPCETVLVTDDIYSASIEDAARRRGIAGGLIVFKIAGAAAAAGLDLAEVSRLAGKANARTRSLGVAFSGCTFPGASAPLFTVPAGQMALGMGIHGEPGILDAPLPTADELADIFVDGLMAEAPEGVDSRVVVILNGLGSVKYEELFVVYRRVAQRLRDHGLTTVDPEVGEFVTSFEMAGASMTLCWLDEELERYWSAPADSPAYRKGAVAAHASREIVLDADATDEEGATIIGSDSSRRAAELTVRAFEMAKSTIDVRATELGNLDSIAGDGDHGIGMQRGLNAAISAARTAAAAGAGAGTVLHRAADAWADVAGGTSGALWGLGLNALADVVGDVESPDTADLLRGLELARAKIEVFGKARPGDKTMLDALAPLIDTLQSAPATADDRSLWRSAAASSVAGAEATRDLLPRTGRARPHAEKSLGTPDPGAISLAAIAESVIEELTRDA